MQGSSIEDRVSGAGEVTPALVEGLRAVLKDESLDGTFRGAAISLPANSELIALIPEADPVLIYKIRCACALPPRPIDVSPVNTYPQRPGHNCSMPDA